MKTEPGQLKHLSAGSAAAIAEVTEGQGTAKRHRGLATHEATLGEEGADGSTKTDRAPPKEVQPAGAGNVECDAARPGNDPYALHNTTPQCEPSPSPGAAAWVKRVVRKISKQSGVRGVWWDQHKNAWCMRWREAGKRINKRFTVNHYMAPGKTYEAADAEALREAAAFRKGLVDSGVVKVHKAMHEGAALGVNWCKTRKSWAVYVYLSGKRRLFGGLIKPKDDTAKEIENARLEAMQRQRQLELEHGDTAVQVTQVLGPREFAKYQSGMPGVTWRKFEGKWRAKIKFNGKSHARLFAPARNTPEEIERACVLAVEYHRKVSHALRTHGKLPDVKQ
eukprot:CAMPEP_0168384814 /NCGR_PEP_ID=MMETSP0228-20121227/14605_1 /TAXON_ID=133427 /ORGANISM="Protoceratium reticulatum, Strain CCCM 535 (=CCMP 1889)" /LENGTH=335 /DNA_ID=CAMNT_0008397993 /DNA_START=63 /DNA_END=1070 /DNA_ORIENTATION=-